MMEHMLLTHHITFPPFSPFITFLWKSHFLYSIMQTEFSIRGCVQRLQELFCATRLSMSRIMARQIQASSLLGSSS